MGRQEPHVWVDADSFPAAARTEILYAARRHDLAVTYVANRDIPFGVQGGRFAMAVCPAGADEADRYIARHAAAGDVVATRDIPLAGQLVGKVAAVINDRGLVFTEETVAAMLRERELSMQMAALGIRPGYGRGGRYGAAEVAAFRAALERVLREYGGR